MNFKQTKYDYKKSADFNFVVCAKTAGVEIVSFDKQSDGKTFWFLKKSALLDRIYGQYLSGQLCLPVQELFYNQKLLKSQIYN